MIRLHLWSSPRNISTAIMYSFAQRPDTKVVDEPLYAHYLTHQKTEAAHPGQEAILASQDANGERVARYLLTNNYGSELAVFKQMTHHLLNFTEDFKVAMLTNKSNATLKSDLPATLPGDKVANVLLIRDPRAILNSFSKVVTNVTAEDIGLPQQYELFQLLRKHNALTAIVDARKLLLNPAGQLRSLCTSIGITFTDKMLSWAAGPRSEDGIWAEHWYANVHKSTGFKPYVEKEITLSPELEEIAKTCTPLYEEMLVEAI